MFTDKMWKNKICYSECWQAHPKFDPSQQEYNCLIISNPSLRNLSHFQRTWNYIS